MEISRHAAANLCDYGKIPIAFSGQSRLDLKALAEGHFNEVPTSPFLKNYDALEAHSNWPSRFDVRNWVWFETEGGGAIVAWNTPEVDMLEGRNDLAVLWDIRVHPDHRGKGIGRNLVMAAEAWSAEKGCTELKVETQDINVTACRFYAAMGFGLSEIVPNAYDGLGEAMLIWRKRLTANR